MTPEPEGEPREWDCIRCGALNCEIETCHHCGYHPRAPENYGMIADTRQMGLFQ
jgi:ribosomal protein L37E